MDAAQDDASGGGAQVPGWRGSYAGANRWSVAVGTPIPSAIATGRAEQTRHRAYRSFVQWRAPPGHPAPRLLHGVWGDGRRDGGQMRLMAAPLQRLEVRVGGILAAEVSLPLAATTDTSTACCGSAGHPLVSTDIPPIPAYALTGPLAAKHTTPRVSKFPPDGENLNFGSPCPDSLKNGEILK